jgi:hypothetical protein
LVLIMSAVQSICTLNESTRLGHHRHGHPRPSAGATVSPGSLQPREL